MSHAQFFQALADETRLRMVLLLADGRELAVCEMVQALQEAQPKVSRHLAYLREARLVDVRRRAQWVLYRLADGLAPWQRRAIEAARAGLGHERPFVDDARRLRRAAAAGGQDGGRHLAGSRP
jgi:ArsR family transcriptional regulator